MIVTLCLDCNQANEEAELLGDQEGRSIPQAQCEVCGRKKVRCVNRHASAAPAQLKNSAKPQPPEEQPPAEVPGTIPAPPSVSTPYSVTEKIGRYEMTVTFANHQEMMDYIGMVKKGEMPAPAPTAEIPAEVPAEVLALVEGATEFRDWVQLAVSLPFLDSKVVAVAKKLLENPTVDEAAKEIIVNLRDQYIARVGPRAYELAERAVEKDGVFGSRVGPDGMAWILDDRCGCRFMICGIHRKVCAVSFSRDEDIKDVTINRHGIEAHGDYFEAVKAAITKATTV